MKTYSIKEAALLLQVSHFTVRRYILMGDLKAIKKQTGKRYIYQITQSEIDRMKIELGIDETKAVII